MVRIDLRVGRESDHHQGNAATDGLLERCKVGCRRRRVDDVPRVVGVALHAAESGEVLRAGDDTGARHPPYERERMQRDLRGVVSVLTMECSDRLILSVSTGWHDVEDGR